MNIDNSRESTINFPQMKPVIVTLCAVLSLALSLFCVGCETKSATEAEVLVDPPAITLKNGESATFTATGWHEYRWSLQHEDWGILSNKTGDRTVYTSISSASGVQTLTVTAVNTNTNEPTTAKAYISHL